MTLHLSGPLNELSFALESKCKNTYTHSTILDQLMEQIRAGTSQRATLGHLCLLPLLGLDHCGLGYDH